MAPGFPSVSTIERALASRPHPERNGADLEASVLVCLHAESLLVVRRTAHPGDKWSGHMGLPGGRHEPQDADLLATALRETREELGFEPLRHGRLLGSLGSYEASHRRRGDAAIGVFVAHLDERPPLALSDEIAAAFWVRTSALVPGSAAVPEYPDRAVPAYLPEADGERLVIWGITFGILERLRGLA